jgi:hypothetical protein
MMTFKGLRGKASSQGHMATTWWNWDSNPGSLAQESVLWGWGYSSVQEALGFISSSIKQTKWVLRTVTLLINTRDCIIQKHVAAKIHWWEEFVGID